MENIIILLSIAFLILLFAICGRKGFRLLFSLMLTVVALIWVIVPLIVHGYNPELVVFLAGLPVLVIMMYLTEGFTVLAHVSIVAVILNFILASLISYAAVSMAGLTGLVTGDASFLGIAGINLQQLLIAGIMLGTLGILTEMVVTQAATVIEFMNASPDADSRLIYRQSYAVGVAHLGSIVNTLFLVYAGVSFPLLITYAGGGSSLHDALNYEPLVSEIIRVLAGTISLIIAMPTSTYLAVRWMKGSFAKRL